MSEEYQYKAHIEYSNEKGMGYSERIVIDKGIVTLTKTGPDMGDSKTVTFELSVIKKVIAKYEKFDSELKE